MKQAKVADQVEEYWAKCPDCEEVHEGLASRSDVIECDCGCEFEYNVD